MNKPVCLNAACEDGCPVGGKEIACDFNGKKKERSVKVKPFLNEEDAKKLNTIIYKGAFVESMEMTLWQEENTGDDAAISEEQWSQLQVAVTKAVGKVLTSFTVKK